MARRVTLMIAICGSLTVLSYVIINFSQKEHRFIHVKFDSFIEKLNGRSNVSKKFVNDNSNKTGKKELSQCTPEKLGFMTVPLSQNEVTSLYASREKPQKGGFWSPLDCQPAQNIAILFPYRNRSENLIISTSYMHNFLQKQKVSYRIFVIEQNDKKLFNRAKLLNVGFKESDNFGGPYDCYFLHDMDKLPEHTQNLYHCDKNHPRHMIAYMRPYNQPANQKSSYKSGILYSNFFGGITAFTRKLFLKVNGMSNQYFGWGREDDNLMARMRIRQISPSYTRNVNAKYVNLKHPSDVIVNKIGWPYQHVVGKQINDDGLSHLNYSLIKTELKDLYTHILVDL